MWINSGLANERQFQIEKCQELVSTANGKDIFKHILDLKTVPIYDCSKARLAAMCVALSKGNHV